VNIYINQCLIIIVTTNIASVNLVIAIRLCTSSGGYLC